jgi:thiol-disulfide isomerase/thioredoxin
VKSVPAKTGGWSRRRWLRDLSLAVGTTAAASATEYADARLALAADATAAPPTTMAWPALVAPDGRAVDTAGWQGVPLVVVFWATWCAFCERHNARVDKLHRTLDPARLRVLGVAMDRDGTAVQHYLRRHGYGFPVALEGGQLRTRFTARRIIPMTCTVGADGRVRQCIPGEMAEDDVMELARLALPPAR